MIDTIIDMAIVDRQIDALVDSITLAGWKVERPGSRKSRERDKVIRYLGMKGGTAQSEGGSGGANLVPVTLKFVVGTVTKLGEGTYLSTHHAGAGTSAILAGLVGASFNADGHVGCFRKFDFDDAELGADVFAVERVVMVHGEVQRISGTAMSTVS